MLLKSIQYSEFDDTPKKWGFAKIQLNPINLIVGKNATGKTRALNVITNLAHLMSGEKKLEYASGRWNLELIDNKKVYTYKLEVQNAKVLYEYLKIDNKVFLERDGSGLAEMYFEAEQKKIRIQIPSSELICASRQDNVQHPYLNNLFSWGKNLRLYKFGSLLGQTHFYIAGNQNNSQAPNPKMTDSVVHLFLVGKQNFGSKFINSIIEDMKFVGYKCSHIDVGPIEGVKPAPNFISQEIVGLYILEDGVPFPISQVDISQGMFRSLSLFIQLNFAKFNNESHCIVIDDVGEGLDFERSSSLIRLLISKVEDSSNQLILSTNDRFVMNIVKLKYWIVMTRNDNGIQMLNYDNSKKLFDDFEFTGLNNFDFFSSDYHIYTDE